MVNANLPGAVRPSPEGITVNAPLAVTAWREVLDYPRYGEFEGWESAYEGFGSQTSGMIEGFDGQERTEKEAIETQMTGVGNCFECDKLGGWPCWEQGDETPQDANGVPMAYLFQVGHKGLLLGDFDAAAIDWPTWGRGHVFGSAPTGELTYVWSCD